VPSACRQRLAKKQGLLAHIGENTRQERASNNRPPCPFEGSNLEEAAQRFGKIADRWIPKPKILHPFPNVRFFAKHPR